MTSNLLNDTTYCTTTLEMQREFCTNLHKGVDSKNGEVRVTLGIIDKVEINKFLKLQIFSLHAVHHIREQH